MEVLFVLESLLLKLFKLCKPFILMKTKTKTSVGVAACEGVRVLAAWASARVCVVVGVGLGAPFFFAQFLFGQSF